MNVKALGRCIDQPLILNRLQTKIPAILLISGAAYGAIDTFKSTKNKPQAVKREKIIKNSIIIAATAASSLMAANGLKIAGKKLIPQLIKQPLKSDILAKQNIAINDFLHSGTEINEKLKKTIEKTRKKPLNIEETKVILEELPKNEAKKRLLRTILPTPDNLSSKEIFSEIGRLSLLGAIPVLGGILGGIAADKVTKTETPKSTANKIKEGFYQYFANIFLCNVGAAAALFSAEGLQKSGIIKPLNSLQKMAVILTGITATGIIGGSWIANKLSQSLIDPIFNKNTKNKPKKVYEERKPELADIALHVDDIATAGVLSGFKWIEPALPLMYFISGYRAGIGYRNNDKH